MIKRFSKQLLYHPSTCKHAHGNKTLNIVITAQTLRHRKQEMRNEIKNWDYRQQFEKGCDIHPYETINFAVMSVCAKYFWHCH